MSDLKELFENKEGNLVNKPIHFFDIYDAHFSRFKDTDVHILEIGVDSGGSLDLWRDYFGPKAKIYGMDVNPACKKLEDDGYHIFIGSQSNPDFLNTIADSMPRIDILIDDGGHRMEQQIITFESMFDKIEINGFYVCEDICTSYYLEYGGGYKKRRTFIEYSKNFIDSIHAWHSRDHVKFPITNLTKTIKGIHFYNNMLIIEKGQMSEPTLIRRGTRTITLSEEMTGNPSFEEPLKFKLIKRLPWPIQKRFQ